MQPATLSIQVFGAYVVLTGVGLVAAPALVLGLLGLAAPADVWIRVLGALAIVVGYYYWACGAAGAVAFFRASVVGRPLFAVLCVALIVVFQAPMQLLLFAAVDLAGAAWTWHALRKAPRT
ncbi:MAG: hypothetical protein MUF16_19590 [Burkholderiaceae bacterium]|jgi:hypothetical protein|nr:hypothetical protein [Burkholderiaceae bacterium]